MSRVHNMEIINERLDGNGEVNSGAEHAEPLGRADVGIFHIKVSGITVAGGTAVLNVDYLSGNDGKVFLAPVALVDEHNLTPGQTYEAVVDTASANLGAYGRLAVLISGATNPSMHIRVIACGRTR